MPAQEERVAGSLPRFGFPPAEDDWSYMRSDERGLRGRAPRGGRSGNGTHEGHIPPDIGGDWGHCAGLDLRYFEADDDGWFMPRMVFQLFNRKESLKDGIGLPKENPRDFYLQWPLMKFAQNNVWTLRSIGKNHNVKERIRDYILLGSMEGWQPR